MAGPDDDKGGGEARRASTRTTRELEPSRAAWTLALPLAGAKAGGDRDPRTTGRLWEPGLSKGNTTRQAESVTCKSSRIRHKVLRLTLAWKEGKALEGPGLCRAEEPWEGVPAAPSLSVHQACYSLTLVAWPRTQMNPVTLVGGHGGGVGG